MAPEPQPETYYPSDSPVVAPIPNPISNVDMLYGGPQINNKQFSRDITKAGRNNGYDPIKNVIL